MYVMLACFAFLFFEIPFCYIPGLALNSAPSNQSSIQLSSGSWDYKHICTNALDLKAFTLERSYFEIIRLKSMNSLFSHKGITFPSTYHTACACQEWTLKSKVTNFCLHVHKQHTLGRWLSYGTSQHSELLSPPSRICTNSKDIQWQILPDQHLWYSMKLRLTSEPSAGLVAEKICCLPTSSTVFL